MGRSVKLLKGIIRLPWLNWRTQPVQFNKRSYHMFCFGFGGWTSTNSGAQTHHLSRRCLYFLQLSRPFPFKSWSGFHHFSSFVFPTFASSQAVLSVWILDSEYMLWFFFRKKRMGELRNLLEPVLARDNAGLAGWLGGSGTGLATTHHSFRGSFSAVSKPIFASK